MEWWGLSRETWNLGWILYCEGSSSSYVTGLTWWMMGKVPLNLGLSFLQGSLSQMSLVESYTRCPGWKVGVVALRTFAWCLWRHTALWRCWCADSQTLSLSWNQWAADGISEGSPDQGNKGGWLQSTHWKGVRSVEGWKRQFCVYSAQAMNRFQKFWCLWQKLRR